MGKQIIWIISFLGLAFIGDRGIGFFLKKTTENSKFRYSRLYNSNEDADILFVGNSRGLTFYQPEVESITTLKTMNLSYNGMPADLAKCLVMDYLDRHNPPKIMVVDITMCDRRNDMLKSGFNLYTPFSMRLDTLLKGIKTPDDWAGRKVVYGGNVSWLYRHNSEIFQRVLYHRKKSDEDWLIDRVIGESATKDTSFKSYQVRMFPDMVDHLREMIAYAQSKGVAVKLVINPYFPQFAETIRDSFLTPLKSFVETQTNMPVHDFSTVLKEREEIGDYQHANKKGSINFMRILQGEGFFNFEAQNNNNSENIGATIINNQAVDSMSFTTTSHNVNQAPPSLPETVLTPVSITGDEVKTVKKMPKKKRKYKDETWYSVDTLFSN